MAVSEWHYIITRWNSHNIFKEVRMWVLSCWYVFGTPTGQPPLRRQNWIQGGYPMKRALLWTHGCGGVQHIHSGCDVEVSRTSEQRAALSSALIIQVFAAFVLQGRCSGFRIALVRRIPRVTSRCANPFFGWQVPRCDDVRNTTTAFSWTVASRSLNLSAARMETFPCSTNCQYSKGRCTPLMPRSTFYSVHVLKVESDKGLRAQCPQHCGVPH